MASSRKPKTDPSAATPPVTVAPATGSGAPVAEAMAA
jgi:hypothetical protein